MKKIISIIIIAIILGGCSLFRPHKMDIEQGNVITTQASRRVHVGMSVDEVKHLLGNPVFVTTFADNRMNYVYTYLPAYERMQEKRLTLTFHHGRVSSIQRY